MIIWDVASYTKQTNPDTCWALDVWRLLVRNVIRRFDDFCTVIKPVLCTAGRWNIYPCYNQG